MLKSDNMERGKNSEKTALGHPDRMEYSEGPESPALFPDVHGNGGTICLDKRACHQNLINLRNQRTHRRCAAVEGRNSLFA